MTEQEFINEFKARVESGNIKSILDAQTELGYTRAKLFGEAKKGNIDIVKIGKYSVAILPKKPV